MNIRFNIFHSQKEKKNTRKTRMKKYCRISFFTYVFETVNAFKFLNYFHFQN